MKNWLGQDIEPGKIVYRGARDGNSSTYKVGQVMSVNTDTRKVRVEWLVEHGIFGVTQKLNPGICDVNSLVILDMSRGEIEGVRRSMWQKMCDARPGMRGRTPWWEQ